MSEKIKIALISIICFVLLGGCIYLTFFPQGRALWNQYDETMKKVDDKTTYETRKKVEDTCRSSIASYNLDKLTYEQYKDSTSELERSWANSAKMRANKTASIYNEYMLKNSYVFEDNIPSDIYMELPIIE
ncbi:MAG: hypothetical protein ACLRT4_18180 [Thomasclavelia sp.]